MPSDKELQRTLCEVLEEMGESKEVDEQSSYV